MNFLEDRQITSASQTRSIRKCRDSLPIPMDLVIEIFLRLPAKSVGKCRCLSKFWTNVIDSQYFVDLFSAKSSARPRILFASPINFSFFSADQPFENSSSDNVARTHVTHYPYPISNNPLSSNRCVIGVPINGLVCLSEYVRYIPVPVIYNPSTGEFLTLPKLKTMWRREDTDIRNMLGYDPNKKQFKVLSIDANVKEYDINNLFVKYQVLTLETEQLSWRTIECFTPHYNLSTWSEICINGILYYGAFEGSREYLIVCFDVRSETFRFIKVMETFNKSLPGKTILTNYNGKLGLLIPEEYRPKLLSGESRSFELWVLKDAEKKEWLKHVFVLPPVWKKVVTETELAFVGMIGTNKIVLSSFYTYEPPYFFSYNIRKNTIRRINIQDKKASISIPDIVFLNHVENVMSLSKFLK